MTLDVLVGDERQTAKWSRSDSVHLSRKQTRWLREWKAVETPVEPILLSCSQPLDDMQRLISPQ